jgi:hypothetical protein
MKTDVLFNSNMHFEHKQWKRELAFWQDELKSFNNRLDELVSHHEDKDTLAKLEHYQNEFILHEGVIEDLLEAIEEHETRIAAQSKTGLDELDTKMSKKHIEFRDRMETQRHIYAELKKNFFKFLEKHM